MLTNICMYTIIITAIIAFVLLGLVSILLIGMIIEDIKDNFRGW